MCVVYIDEEKDTERREFLKKEREKRGRLLVFFFSKIRRARGGWGEQKVPLWHKQH